MRISDETKAVFIEELEKTDLPFAAIVQGIRSLTTEEIKTIKFATITAAARRFVQVAEVSKSCDHCQDGVVLMKSDGGYRFALGCVCDRGAQRALAMNIPRWNGERFQHGAKGMLQREIGG